MVRIPLGTLAVPEERTLSLIAVAFPEITSVNNQTWLWDRSTSTFSDKWDVQTGSTEGAVVFFLFPKSEYGNEISFPPGSYSLGDLKVQLGSTPACDTIEAMPFGYTGLALYNSDSIEPLSLLEGTEVCAVARQVEKFSLQVNGAGSGRIKVDGSLESLPYNGSFERGSVVWLDAVPDNGWNFSGWSGDNDSTSSSVPIRIDKNKTITATFGESEFTLNLSKVGGGKVKVNGSEVSLPYSRPMVAGQYVSLAAVPDSGWQFGFWGGVRTGSGNPSIEVQMLGDKDLTANFKVQLTTTLSLGVVGKGQIKVDGILRDLPWSETFAAGSRIPVEATPSWGWDFKKWSDGLVGSSPQAEVVLITDKHVVAEFEQLSAYLDVAATGNGQVRLNGTLKSPPFNERLGKGDTATIEAVPDSGWKLANWSGAVSGSVL